VSERTLGILKPDCVRRGLVGQVLAKVEQEGFAIKALRLTKLSREEAEQFYAVHREKHFFGELVEFMTSGPCIPLILEKDNAIQEWRRVLEEVRQEHAGSLTENIAHGSDAPETAAFECGFMFRGTEVY
jgi:nucleoside-diphosphate kinase